MLTFGVPACLIASESELQTDASSANMTANEGNGSTPHSRRIDSLWNKIPPAQMISILKHNQIEIPTQTLAVFLTASVAGCAGA